jgi:hypothetical protein
MELEEKDKLEYLSPEIQVIEVNVEKGFASSMPGGNPDEEEF